APSTATPCGFANCPTALPGLPHFVRKAPSLVNFWMRLLFTSGTKTFPFASTASSSGSLNCPSPLPRVPHLVTNVPHESVSIVVVVVVLLLDVLLLGVLLVGLVV